MANKKTKYAKHKLELENKLKLKIMREQEAIERQQIFRESNTGPILLCEWECPLCGKFGHMRGREFHIRTEHFTEYSALNKIDSSVNRRVRGPIVVGGGGPKLPKRQHNNEQ